MSYRCTLTLAGSTEEEAIGGSEHAAGAALREAYDLAGEDDLGDLPMGWIEVTVRRRVANPLFARLHDAKARSIEGQLQQILPPGAANPDGTPITDEQREEIRMMAIQPTVDALFFAAESRTPPFVTEDTVVYVANPDRYPAAAKAWAEIAGRLGLPAYGGE